MSNLLIEFIEGSKKITFDLEISSYFLTEAGGIPWENTFNLVLNNEFLDFWKYLKEYYSYATYTQIGISNEKLIPDKAVITQKNRGVDSNLPWVTKLEISDNLNTESIFFNPFSCELISNE